jgi:hypothetical protein
LEVGIAPDLLKAAQVQDCLHYLRTERQLSWNTANTIVADLRFFYA